MHNTSTLQLKKDKLNQGKLFSDIAAMVHVSESEIVKVYPDYKNSWHETDNEKLKQILNDFGIDTTRPIYLQGPFQHRNRLNEIVTCFRYYGDERMDKEWINSGYASRELLDKVKGGRFINELYQMKGLTNQAQVAASIKDSYAISEEDKAELALLIDKLI